MYEEYAGKLAGQTVFITGGSRGIGAEAARAFAASGASVCIAARNKDELNKVVLEIREAGNEAMAVPCDVTDYESVKRALKETEEAYGGIDIVYANAGVVLQRELIEECDIEKWKKTVEINFFGVFHTLHAAIPFLKRRGGGKMISTGSGRGRRAAAANSDYGCSKAASWMLMRALALELKDYNIAVNEFIPGAVMTDMNRGWGDKADPIFTTGIEHVRTPKDCIPMLMFIATLSNTEGPTGQFFNLNRREI